MAHRTRCMMVFIAACLWANAASATDFVSKFGFHFDLPAPWQALTPARVANSRDPLLQGIRDGTVEAFLYGNTGNNVFLSVSTGAPVATRDVDKHCRSAEKRLSGPDGAVTVQACKSGTRNGVAYFLVEWTNLSTQHRLFHAEIGMSPGKLLLVAGEAEAASADAVRAMQMRVIEAATLKVSVGQRARKD